MTDEITFLNFYYCKVVVSHRRWWIFKIFPWHELIVVVFLAEPKALLEICRRQIRIQMVQGNVGVDELPLPSTLKRYVDCSACR